MFSHKFEVLVNLIPWVVIRIFHVLQINRTSTIKEGPTITHAFAQGPTRLFELQADNSCVLSSDSDNSDLVEIESEPERERLSEDKVRG